MRERERFPTRLKKIFLGLLDLGWDGRAANLDCPISCKTQWCSCNLGFHDAQVISSDFQIGFHLNVNFLRAQLTFLLVLLLNLS